MKTSLLNSDDMEIGITFKGRLISSLGDNICLTPIIENLYHQKNELITVSTLLPELFLNNPYVKDTVVNNNPRIVLFPSIRYEYNIIEYYAEQMEMDIPKGTAPKIYLSPDEIEYGKILLKEFEGFKKITISLETGANCKTLRFEYIKPILDKLKRNGYKLIAIGKESIEHKYEYDKSFINKTTIREVSSIINQCDLYFGIDAGLYHIAAALNVPQVVFFRNNESSNNSYPNTFFSNSRIKCPKDCLTTHLSVCMNNNRCMDNFDLDEYFNLVNKILENK